MSQPIDVAIAVIVRRGQVLICRRKAGGSFAGYWEFPGGKCRAGEEIVACLARELKEELSIVVKPVRKLTIVEYDYPEMKVRLHPFLCALVSGRPTALAADKLQWVGVKKLAGYHQFHAVNKAVVASVLCLLASPKVSDSILHPQFSLVAATAPRLRV